MRASLICTVLNEGESIRKLMDSLCAQTQLPDEVIIVDGGSRDNTVAVLAEYQGRVPLRVLVEPGANISRGRNIAITAATGDIIASVDAGVRLESRWLERLIDGFASAENRDGRAAVAGFFVADGQTTFEIAMGATVLPTVDEIKPEGFLPSSRSVAFTKAAWQIAGGYPEWIDYCEDLIFDFKLREVTGRFGWAPDALVHFRPRGSFRSFFKQYYRYARGDGKADLWRKRHAIRYATYLVALPVLLALSIWHHALWLLVLIGGVTAYCRAPYRRLARHLPAMTLRERVRALALVPLIRGVGDVAKMLGYPAGWVWRLKNWRRPEIHWRTTSPPGPLS